MNQSMGKIVWGYIWRLILWGLLVAFVFTFIFRLVLGLVISGNSVGSTEATILYYKIYLIGTIIISVLIMILACKFATSGIRKKFSIDESNASQVFKCIMIVLIVITVLLVIYEVFYIFNVRTQMDELSSQIDDTKNLLQQYSNEILNSQMTGQIEELESFLNFCNVFIIIGAVINVIIPLLMIPFEKKLLKA